MENSILKSTKKILGVVPDHTEFDTDIITHINSVFSIINQLGVGPADTFSIEDDTAVWDDLALPSDQTGLVRTYMFLKVRMLFDPPNTSFLIGAVNAQIQEYETRLSYMRESLIPVPDTTIEREEALWEELFRQTWG